MKFTKQMLCALLLMLTMLSTAACGKPEAAMVVDGQEVPMGVVDYYISYGQEFLTSYGIDPTDAEIGAQYMSMIEEQAIDIVTELAVARALAFEAGLSVDEATLTDALAKEKNNFATEEAWQEWLSTYNLAEDDVKWILESQQLSTQYYEHLMADFTPDEAEIAAIYNADPESYDSYRYAHILVSIEGEADEKQWQAAEDTANDLIDQINADANAFATLAAQYNADSTKNTGGDLGQYITKNSSPYVEEFTTAAFTLDEVGAITQQPVRTTFGYHIIKLLDMKVGLEAVHDDIKAELCNTEGQIRYTNAMTEAIANAEITKEYAYRYKAAAPVNEQTDDAGTATEEK